MLPADPEVELRICCSTFLHCDLHQAPHARPIDRHERVCRDELALLVHAEKLPDVVAREAERGLGEVVRAEREKVRDFPDLTGRDASPR